MLGDQRVEGLDVGWVMKGMRRRKRRRKKKEEKKKRKKQRTIRN